MGRVHKFSFNHEDDALESLATYYEVDKKLIYEKLRKINNLVKEQGKLCDTDIGKYAYCIRRLLTDKEEKSVDKLRVSYYHRCGSDGTLEWFGDGLLNCNDGFKKFIEKISNLYPSLLSENLKDELNGRLKERFKGEAFGRQAVGIFAFTRLEEAKIRKSYDLPEIFMDISNLETRKSITTFLKSKLKPTVVKFYKEYDPNELDSILFTYWYLICQKFDEGITSNSLDVGCGKVIPLENIEHIYDLGSHA